MMILATMIQILNVGLEWAGFPALAFYMHSVLKQLQVDTVNMSFLSHLSSPKRKKIFQLPFSEYWVAVALSGYRSALVLSLSFIMWACHHRHRHRHRHRHTEKLILVLNQVQGAPPCSLLGIWEPCGSWRSLPWMLQVHNHHDGTGGCHC